MACYISSNNNRFYVKREADYGHVAAITEANRIPAVKLVARQKAVRPERRDKTGGRSFAGSPNGSRKETSFELTTYLTSWGDPSEPPAYGPLFEAAMGAAPQTWTGRPVANTNGNELTFSAAHGLTVGQGVAFGGEIRFVTAVVDGDAVQLNAPFSLAPGAGDMTSPTVTYRLATGLPSASIFDYWDPADAVQRLISGAAVNEMAIKVNADFHEFTFSGEAADLLDSVSFTNGQAGLSTYPVEPAVLPLAYDVIPGHLGQVWMGTTASRFYTLTEAEVKLDNDLDLRANEFGSERPSCVSAGRRNVSLNLSLYEQRNAMTRDLYEAARNQTPITVMFQLGQQPGQLFGVYLNSVVPEVPEFDDSDPRLQWRFKNCRAQGSDNDELILAFA